MSKKYKKSQVNQVFIYLISIIVVVFAGFLVTKFVINFSSDAKLVTENKIFETFEQDFKQVYIKYGAENVNKYRLSSDIETICFVETTCQNSNNLNLEQNTQIKTIIIGGDNVILFDNNKQIIGSKNIGIFKVKSTDNNGCLCLNPSNNYISVVFTNEQNIVWIKDNS